MTPTIGKKLQSTARNVIRWEEHMMEVTMKHPVVRALVVGVLFVLVYQAIQVISGMYLTMKHVPSIVTSYESAKHLPSQVSFGGKSNPLWSVMELGGPMLVGMGVYGIIRSWRRKRVV
jgi:quinol-cytochrome oxidoreductase complex cytochrome b subunit